MRRWGGVLAGVVLAAGSLVAVGVAPAGAATFTVDDASDGAPSAADCTSPVAGSCSLWDAFDAANTNSEADVITITPGLGIITLSGPLFHTKNEALTIQGNGATVQGNYTFQLINSQIGNGLLTIDGLTLTKGNGNGSSGGAIFSSIAAVTVSNSTFTDNQTADGNGGAIYANSAVTVTNSTFTNNRAGSGGAIFADSGVTVTNSTFAKNEAGSGGALFAYGVVTVSNSTISGNTATASGGGIAVCGSSSVVLVYATVVANSAPDGANIAGSACIDQVGPALALDDPLVSFGSVVALPQGGGENCSPGITDDPVGYNFSDDTSCAFSAATDKQDAGDPLLGALASNGGPTQTRLPQSGSPLIDAIPNANCGGGNTLAGFAVTTDQRHLVRPEQSGGKCDIGAVEVQLPPEPAPTPAAAPAAAPVETVIRFTG